MAAQQMIRIEDHDEHEGGREPSRREGGGEETVGEGKGGEGEASCRSTWTELELRAQWESRHPSRPSSFFVVCGMSVKPLKGHLTDCRLSSFCPEHTDDYDATPRDR